VVGQETLKPGHPSQVEPLMGRVKSYTGGGLGPMYLYYNMFSNTVLPRSRNSSHYKHWDWIKTLKTLKQTLREDVHELGCRRHVQDADITDGHTFSHKVEVDLDMLHVLVLNRVGVVDGIDVVTVDEGAFR
jgi:hypothetical protein